MKSYLRSTVNNKWFQVIIGSLCVLSILPIAAYIDDILSTNPDYCVKRNLVLTDIPMLYFFDEKHAGSLTQAYFCALEKSNIIMVTSDDLLDHYDHTEDSQDVWKYELVKAFYLPEIDSKCYAPAKSKNCVMARFEVTTRKRNSNRPPGSINTIHYVLLVADENGNYKKVKEMREYSY